MADEEVPYFTAAAMRASQAAREAAEEAERIALAHARIAEGAERYAKRHGGEEAERRAVRARRTAERTRALANELAARARRLDTSGGEAI